MPLILGTNSIKDTGYDVANSCRFNDDDDARISRTLGTATNVDKWTMSCWVKRCTLGANSSIFTCYGNGSQKGTIRFDSTDKISAYVLYSGGWKYVQTSAVYRDTSAWMHIVVATDTSQSTDTNRIKLYVNGSLATIGASAYPAQDANTWFNEATEHQIGSLIDETEDGDMYLSEFVFIDGTQYAASDFGEFDSNSPTIWKPKDVSALTFGNNGAYLDFEDSDNLGDDESGNTNDWTETNLAATDQSSDSPTNSFATLNPLNNYWSAVTFSEGNCVYTSNNTSEYYGVAQSTIGVSSGKWYFEAKNSTDSSGQGILGITSRNQTGRSTWLGSTSQAYGYYATGGVIRSSASDTSHGGNIDENDIIGIYMDLDNNKMYVSDNGVLQNSGTGHSITAAASTDSGFYYFAVGDNSDNTQVWQCNFGGTPGFTVSSGNTDDNGYGNFEYSPNITGDGSAKKFYALNTKNLAEFG